MYQYYTGPAVKNEVKSKSKLKNALKKLIFGTLETKEIKHPNLHWYVGKKIRHISFQFSVFPFFGQ